jgi:hypothetical protein
MLIETTSTHIQSKLNEFFFPFHHNPFNNLFPNKIFVPLYIKLLIGHMLIFKRSTNHLFSHPQVQLWPSFCQHTCFNKDSHLSTKSFSQPSITLQTLHLTCVTFPTTPTTNFTQGNFVAHEFWKQRFNSYNFIFLLLCAKFAIDWARLITTTSSSKF